MRLKVTKNQLYTKPKFCSSFIVCCNLLIVNLLLLRFSTA